MWECEDIEEIYCIREKILCHESNWRKRKLLEALHIVLNPRTCNLHNGRALITIGWLFWDISILRIALLKFASFIEKKTIMFCSLYKKQKLIKVERPTHCKNLQFPEYICFLILFRYCFCLHFFFQVIERLRTWM